MILRVVLVLFITAVHAVAGFATDWDVENTGQPYTKAEFSVDEGSWMSVDVSPDGKTLVFDMLGDIYVMPASGGKAKLIHGGSAMQRDPKFSPDGTKLLFISDKSGSDNIWMSDSDGSNAKQITHETLQALTGPSWSADGSYLAAARLNATDHTLHNSELRQYDVLGGEGRLLVPQPTVGENVHEAQFSPDGRYIYYTEKITSPSQSVVFIEPNYKHYAIKRRDLQTGETVEVIKGFGGATTPQISRDGSKIAFVRRVRTQTVLFVYDVKAQTEDPVYADLDRDSQADYIWQGSYYPQYSWFPDNEHIAIWAKGKLWKIHSDTGGATEIPFTVNAQHRLAKPPKFKHDFAPKTFTVKAIRQLAYAPNQDTIVFNALGRMWQKDGSGKPSRVTSSLNLEFEPSYSSDGSMITYVEWNDVSGGKLILRAKDGSWSRTLLESGGVLRAPSFSPDGKTIVYKIDSGDRCLGGHKDTPGLYIIDVQTGANKYIGKPGDRPIFSPDGNRIYYTKSDYNDHYDMITTLESVNLNGFDPRIHAITPDADTSELKISPDLKWIAFRDRQQYYVVRYVENGRTLELSAATKESPVKKLSTYGGYSLTWEADSSALHWAFGDTFKTVKVADFNMAKTGLPKQKLLKAGLVVPSDVPEGRIALVGARLITMKGEEVIENGTVLVNNNRIEKIGTQHNVTIPDGTKIIDAVGKTIMPGIIDMHGHINNCYYTSSGLMPQKQSSRYADLAFGVTTNYDPYTSELSSYSQAEMTLSGDMIGPRAVESGFIAFGRSGKGDTAYLPIENYNDAKILMERKKALGGIIVKSYRQPMRSQRQQLIKAGYDNGIMVDVEGESNYFHNITMLLDGNTNLQHNLPIATYYDDLVQLMKRGETTHTPAIVMLFGELFGENYIYQNMRVWEDPKVRKFVQVATSGYNPLGTPHYAPPHVRAMTSIHAADEIWDIGFRSVAKSIKKLDDAGVIINIGSHGELSGLAAHWEMWLLSEGGMSNHRLLKAATMNGASTLGVDHQLGSLEEGKLADLIVMDKNPLEDIYNTNSIIYTMVNGRLYETENMDEVGNYNNPRDKFYWEAGKTQNIVDWEKAWAHQ